MRRLLPLSLLVGAVLGGAAPAHADELHAEAASPAAPSHHLVYAELLGKAGVYGVGYEFTLSPRLAVGAAASYASVRDQQVATLSPYLHVSIVRGAHHGLYGELGAVVAHSRIPSPVDDWDGMANTGAGGIASLGWERASRHLVLRASGSVVVGGGGVAPWLGLAVGVRP